MRTVLHRRRGRFQSGLVAGAAALAACGTLAAPSTGDVDLAASYVGPYQLLLASQSPSGSSTLVRADGSNSQVDEPSVVRLPGNSRRAVFVTLRAVGQADVIGRALERMDRPAGSLIFEGATSNFHAEVPWEGSYVRSPDVRVVDATHHVMAYASEGGLGIATSVDGLTFTHPSGPAIARDGLDGGAIEPAEPSLARGPMGDWFLAYRRGPSLYLARAQTVAGPWTDGRLPILAPSVATERDATSSPDSLALGDPALSILTTPAGRTLYVLFYTATGASPRTVIGAAASYDAVTWSRVTRVVYADRTNNVRAGSLEVIDARTALLWIGSGAAASRTVSALIGPAVPRVDPPGY